MAQTARMTPRLRAAVAEAAKLDPDAQDTLAAILLAEIEDERRWAEQFARSEDQLERLAQQALADHRAGLTVPLETWLEESSEDDQPAGPTR